MDVGKRPLSTMVCLSSVGVGVFEDARLDEENREKAEKSSDS